MDPAELPLRDIHLPPAPGWWPPAPGWWVLGAIGLATLAALVWLRYRTRGPVPARRTARRELERIRARWNTDGDAAELLRALSALLRRVAMTRLSRPAAAGVHGQAWLEVLDELYGGDAFSTGPGRVLATAPYRPAAGAVDGDTLLRLAARVVDALPAGRRA